MTQKPKTAALSKQDERIATDMARGMLNSIAQQLLLAGIIEPLNKSDNEIRKEVNQYVREHILPIEFPLYMTIDHTGDLLRNARRFRSERKRQLACLLFATWFEHMLNLIIGQLGKKSGLNDAGVNEMLRSAQLRDKCTWLLSILGGSALLDTHRKRIIELSEFRNRFIHYKWKLEDVDRPESEKEDKQLTKLLEEIEMTVTYMRRIEKKYIYLGRKKRLFRNHPGKKAASKETP